MVEGGLVTFGQTIPFRPSALEMWAGTHPWNNVFPGWDHVWRSRPEWWFPISLFIIIKHLFEVRNLSHQVLLK